jgi:hypothetical protein
VKYFLEQIKNKHIPIVEYFLRNGFGTSMPVLTYLSTLKPIDRCIILEKLFESNVRTIHLYDKMVLSYVKVGHPEYGIPVINFARKMGESEFNCRGIEEKLKLVGIPPERTDEQRLIIFRDYLSSTHVSSEIEFLNILIKFIDAGSHYSS